MGFYVALLFCNLVSGALSSSAIETAGCFTLDCVVVVCVLCPFLKVP